MARFRLAANAEIDVLTPAELDDTLRRRDADRDAQALLRAEKKMRLPLVTGKASRSALLMGGDTGPQLVTPAEGYVWSVRHLVIEGLTASASAPDVVNIMRGPRIIWQLNGNQFAQTWGHGEIFWYAGETLTYQSVGTFNSTATIIAHGMVDQVPSQLQGRIA